MEKKIIYRDETQNSSEICRDLANGLFQHQAAQTDNELYREILGNMTYESRLQRAFNNSNEKLLLVAYDGEKPIGYVFCSAELLTAQGKDGKPPWAAKLPANSIGFYPDWLETPVRVGELNNLFVLPEYRGLKIGQELTDRAMEWLRAREGVQWLFVDVSNGNNAGTFYERNGFAFSHDVLGGIIKAYCQKVVND